MTDQEILKCVSIIHDKKQDLEADNAMKALIKQFTPCINKAIIEMDPVNEAEDAFSAGVEGLCVAAQRFNPEAGTKFFTFAYNYIRGYIGWNLRDSRLIRISNRDLDMLRKPGNEEEFSKRTNFVSLNTLVRNEDSEGSPAELESFFGANDPNFEFPDEEEEREKQEKQERAEAFLKEIVFSQDNKPSQNFYNAPTHKHDGEMFCHLYGILGYVKLTDKELSEKFSINESTVKIRCDAIIDKLRSRIRHMAWSKLCRTLAAIKFDGEGPLPEDADIGPLFGAECEEKEVSDDMLLSVMDI